MSYANVMSTLAVFLVVSGGTAVAAATITGADIVDDSVTGADIKTSSLSGGDVSDGTIASIDVSNQSLATEDVRDASLGGIDITNGSVTGADLAAGTVTKRELKAVEAWRTVGAPGEIGFHAGECMEDVVCEWRSFSSDPVAFYKDPYGVVRMQGSACPTNHKASEPPGNCDFRTPRGQDELLFTLPVGYRPSQLQTLGDPSSGESFHINTDGTVRSDRSNEGWVDFDGVDFRAAG
jgi:hypothetical protein